MCSAWIHTTVAVSREVRYDPQGGGGIEEPTEWERLKPKFTPEQRAELMRNTSGRDNLCIEGRLAPELIVIGAMISATNSFNTALAYSPGLVFPSFKFDWKDKKPNHVQSGRGERDSQHTGGKGPDADAADPPVPYDGWRNGQGHFFDVMYWKGREFMGMAYPVCTASSRRVAVDSTSRYSQDPAVAGNIASWYGVAKGSRLKFVFILRDPLVRLQEHFWKAKKGHWCMKLPAKNFEVFAKLLLKGLGKWYAPGGHIDTGYDRCEEILGASLYTSQIKNWFWTFRPNQFTFIPFRLVVEGDSTRSAPVELVWGQLGVRGLTPPRVHANVLPESHPTLDEELSKAEQEAFRTYYRSEMGPREVSEVLASTSATLYGFQGGRSVSEVTNWLVDNW